MFCQWKRSFKWASPFSDVKTIWRLPGNFSLVFSSRAQTDGYFKGRVSVLSPFRQCCAYLSPLGLTLLGSCILMMPCPSRRSVVTYGPRGVAPAQELKLSDANTHLWESECQNLVTLPAATTCGEGTASCSRELDWGPCVTINPKTFCRVAADIGTENPGFHLISEYKELQLPTASTSEIHKTVSGKFTIESRLKSLSLLGLFAQRSLEFESTVTLNL